jgi:O-antigen/teichoic acid export membrane protein
VLVKALHTLGTQALGTLAAIAFGVVLARVLGPTGRGIVSYATLVLGFIAIYADGPAAAVVVQYATDKIRRSDVYAALCRATAILVLPASVVLAIVALIVPGQRPLLAVALALPFAMYGQCVKGFFLAEGRIQTANIVDASALIGNALIGSAIVLLGGGVVGALVAWVVAYALSSFYAAAYLERAPALASATNAQSRGALARGQLAFGTKSGFVYAAGYLNLRMGTFVIAAMLGPAALGIYAIVISVSELLWKVSNALAWSAFGRIAGDEDLAVRRLVGRLTRTILIIESVLGAVVFVTGPWLITHVYGPAFTPAGLPLRIILLGVAAYAIEPVLGYFLLVRAKRPILVFAIQGGSAMVCAAIALATIPVYGISCAAAATAMTYTAVVAVKAVLVARALHMPLVELLVPGVADVRGIIEQLAGAGRRLRSVKAAA